MSALAGQLLFWALAAVALAGALAVVLVRDVLRMALGLGAFLLAVAGFFAYYGFGFLALAELFVYVGGVLVLVLFAIMLVHRGPGGSPIVESRHDILLLVGCAGLSALAVRLLQPMARGFNVSAAATTPKELSALLLGPMLPHFEALGVLLLSALVAVVVVMGGERR